MKKLSLILFTGILFNSLFSQTPSNCNVPTILHSEYQLDVTDLTLKRMYEINSPDTALIDIPQAHLDTIWGGLAALFNAAYLQGKDEVFDVYCVHQEGHNNIYYQSITVRVDTSYSWTQQWGNMQTLTGYTELDSFLTNYSFSITNYNTNWQGGELSTTQFFNFFAFCDSLETYDGIISAYPKGNYYDEDRIFYNKIDSIRYYDFSLRYGDCYSGCICHNTWEYKVYPNCDVEFIGVDYSCITGDPFPSPTNCNISAISNINNNYSLDIKIFPNPSSGIIRIEANEMKQIEIINISGNIVKTININNLDIQNIDINNQAKGIYFLKVITANGTISKKIIIE